jgi:hypothetical protein
MEALETLVGSHLLMMLIIQEMLSGKEYKDWYKKVCYII